jgi:SnoaL-like domain
MCVPLAIARERYARPMEPANVVRQFFELMQARRWTDAGCLLADDVHVEYTATGEKFDGDRFLAMNAEYPGVSELEIVVKEVIALGNRVAAQVVVHMGDESFWCAGFYTVIDERISDGVEHWVTEGSEEPPSWRKKYTSA